MGDAHNLGERLWVLRGWAHESLLDTYEAERRALAKELIEFDKVISASLEGCEASVYSSMLHQQNMFSSGVGVRYLKTLALNTESPTFQYQSEDARIKLGVRFPSASVTRLADWQCIDVQGLLPSDGLFKLLIFCGDILKGEQGRLLQEVLNRLGVEGKSSESLLERVTLHTIVSNEKGTDIWDRLPCALRDWKRVFTVDGHQSLGEQERYTRSTGNTYWIGGGSCFMVLIRPDGYISAIEKLSGDGAGRIREFMRCL
jgi:phenol 2-monooxygenase